MYSWRDDDIRLTIFLVRLIVYESTSFFPGFDFAIKTEAEITVIK